MINRIIVGLVVLLIVGTIGTISYNKEKDKNAKDKNAKARQEALKKQEQAIKLKEKQEEEERVKAEKAEKVKLAVLGQSTSTPIPILMYHSVAYEKNNELRIPKEKFREQMKYLKDDGFTPISLNQLYDSIVFKEALPPKPIVLTFDDGYVDNYTNAFPVLKEFGFKATVFVITSGIDDNKYYMSSEQLKEMDKNGFDVESHTVSHNELNKMPHDQQKNELQGSKTKLETILGRPVTYLAYPLGKFNEDTISALQETGYTMALTTVDGLAQGSNGIYKLKRIYVSDNYSMDYYKKIVNRK